MKDNYSRSVSMQCSTCGGSEFEFGDENGPIRCNGCDRLYSREELKRENGERIEAELDVMKAEVFADVRKDLGKMFKKFR